MVKKHLPKVHQSYRLPPSVLCAAEGWGAPFTGAALWMGPEGWATTSHCGWLAWVNPSHWLANSNQGSPTKGGCTQPTQRAHLKDPAWEIGKTVSLDPTGHLLHRPHYHNTESKQLYLIQRNKHRETAKIRRQINMAQMKEQNKTSEKNPTQKWR